MVKMRKTVYPLAVIIALPLVMVVFVVLNQGHFEQMTANAKFTGKTTESFFRWKGMGTPDVKSVQLEGVEEKGFIVTYNETEEKVLKMVPASMAKEMEQDSTNPLVQIDSIHRKQLESSPAITIHYTIYGIEREQRIKIER